MIYKAIGLIKQSLATRSYQIAFYLTIHSYEKSPSGCRGEHGLKINNKTVFIKIRYLHHGVRLLRDAFLCLAMCFKRHKDSLEAGKRVLLFRYYL